MLNSLLSIQGAVIEREIEGWERLGGREMEERGRRGLGGERWRERERDEGEEDGNKLLMG